MTIQKHNIQSDFLAGDIMGPMVNNLGQFVKMPYGCGEQNMINFVPNIQVLRYLDAANLNKPEIRVKALSYMETGKKID